MDHSSCIFLADVSPLSCVCFVFLFRYFVQNKALLLVDLEYIYISEATQTCIILELNIICIVSRADSASVWGGLCLPSWAVLLLHHSTSVTIWICSSIQVIQHCVDDFISQHKKYLIFRHSYIL